MPPSACQETARRAMAAVNNADALIIDLRDNGGGMGETALQIAGYLFDRPAFLFDPRPNTRSRPTLRRRSPETSSSTSRSTF